MGTGPSQGLYLHKATLTLEEKKIPSPKQGFNPQPASIK
jgi:hypothetical protein